MGYAHNEDSGDFEKLQKAVSDLTRMFGSVDDLLEAFGLANMPTAQRYGIMFGFLVFTCTISAVLILLTLGGSFKRIAQQAETGEATLLSASEARRQRALLLERLLEGRNRMEKNYPDPPRSDKTTKLTEMLLNVAPSEIPNEEDVDLMAPDENVDTTNTITNNDEGGKKEPTYIPQFYKENYVEAYRKCQDRPGGAVMSGRPEARFEAYARGYAGCGAYTQTSYRRSYGRLYEAICCQTHQSDDKYKKLFQERPYDIVGKHVRLEGMQVDRHLTDLYRVTSGEPALEHKSYDPNEVWGFLMDGPFENENELRQSFVFQRKINEAGFAIVHSVTDRLLGCILLTNDDPTNLTIQMEPPIMQPAREGSQQQLEACYLLIDRLFAYGYRRVQIAIDSHDADKRKLAVRLGFTLEGVLYKHMIIKEASRDSNVYSLLNSDWKRGARAALYKKLYGVQAYKLDQSNEKAEEEYEEQQRVLKKKKLEEEKDKKKKE